MTTIVKIEKSRSDRGDKIATSLDPHSKDFNFELWAREVRLQMLTVVRQSLNSCQAKTFK